MGESDGRRLDDPEGRNGPPTRSSGLVLFGLLGGAVLVAVLLGQLTAPDPAPRRSTAVATTTASDLPTTQPDVPIGPESLKRCRVQLGGLALGEDLRVPGATTEIWDCDALTKGPWSVVIRAGDGSFGVKGAVVTFPSGTAGDDSAPVGKPVATPPGGRLYPGTQLLVWPLAGSNAEILGDVGLAPSQLADLAMQVTVVDGRPHFSGLDGFTAEAPTTYRPPLVHEIRYGTRELRQESALGTGEVWTGVTTGASFEFELLAVHAEPRGFVRGKPAIYSNDPGMNWTLAWESAPGEVTYIGYSGTTRGTKAVEALRALADKGTALTPARWLTRFHAAQG